MGNRVSEGGAATGAGAASAGEDDDADVGEATSALAHTNAHEIHTNRTLHHHFIERFFLFSMCSRLAEQI
jgi:hypothetical protein